MKIQKVKQTADFPVIVNKIYEIRGQKVMLDSDLALIYGVAAKRLNEQVKRNIQRFPSDFMFQLTNKEWEKLRLQIETSSGEVNRSQIATSSQKHRSMLYLPYAFTEHGISMLSSVLNSPRAIQMNIYIIRAFIKLREVFLRDQDFEIRIIDLETIQEQQGEDIEEILWHLRHLIDEPIRPKGPMGFQP